MEERKGNTLLAIVQAQDADIAEKALKEAGISSYQLPSVGGFLGRKNVTMVVLNPKDQEDMIQEILKATCSQRIEYVSGALESSPLSAPSPVPVSVGGATIFSLDCERVEFF